MNVAEMNSFVRVSGGQSMFIQEPQLHKNGIMPTNFRDVVSQPLTVDYFHERLSQGWVITAVEWARPLDEGGDVLPPSMDEVPYGQRVAEDCGHLTEHARELEVIAFIYDGVVSGIRPAQIASNLNERSYRTRRGTLWTPTAVFELMPRIIELSPRLQRRPNWPGHRAQLTVLS